MFAFPPFEFILFLSMVLQLKFWKTSQSNKLLCSRSVSKCKSLKIHQDSFFCCSEWDENIESIISFSKPKYPTIVRWLKPAGHEVEHLWGWDDQVLDGTRVSFPRLIMSHFHSRFIHHFKQVDSGKVTKQRFFFSVFSPLSFLDPGPPLSPIFSIQIY
jgi:hypothetical protein